MGKVDKVHSQAEFWNVLCFRRRVPPMDIWLTIRTFIAFYLLLLGVAVMFGSSEQRALLGAFLAALGMSFFWRLWVAMRTGR